MPLRVPKPRCPRHRPYTVTNDAQSRPTRTLLVVDDQHGVCVSLEFFFVGQGYRVLTAGSGQSAIGLIETEQVDGAFIDVHMPGMNGFDTCIALQSRSAAMGRELRVWLMTGAYQRSVETRAKELGAVAVFSKPFDFSELTRRIKEGFAAPLPTPMPLPSASCAIAGDTGGRDAAP